MKKKENKEKTSEYIRRVYGLELNDMDLTEEDSIEEADRVADKLGLDRMEDFNFGMAVEVMKPVATVTGNKKDGWLIKPKKNGKAN